MANPRTGTDVWRGEAEAAEALEWTVEEADADGQLRGILDAVRSHRIKDDFSEHWSYAREDFERKLYRKRSKVKIRFVELTDTIPVQGPETEVEANLVFADFLALLDRAGVGLDARLDHVSPVGHAYSTSSLPSSTIVPSASRICTGRAACPSRPPRRYPPAPTSR